MKLPPPPKLSLSLQSSLISPSSRLMNLTASLPKLSLSFTGFIRLPRDRFKMFSRKKTRISEASRETQSAQPSTHPSVSTSGAQESDGHGPSVASTTVTRQGRGPSIGGRYWGTGVVMQLEFNDHMQVVGSIAGPFSSELGNLIKNGTKVPLNCVSWRDMPEDVLEGVWSEVKANTNAPENFKPVCIAMAHKMWKDWKYRLKTKYYDRNSTKETNKSNVPNRVVDEQWHALVDYWNSDESKEMSTRNSRNREARGPMHLTGRTNFATVRRDLANKGESTEKMNVYVKTRSKEGAPIDTDVVQAMDEYSRRIDEVPEPERTTDLRDRIFYDLIGPDGHGYVRTYGVGVNRSRATGASSSSSQIPGGINLDELRHQIRDELREEIQQEIGDKIRAEIRSQLATLRSPDGSGGVNVRQVPDASSAHRALRESLGDVDIQLQNDSLMPLSHQPTTELPVARTDCEPFQTNIKVGDKVELMSIDIPKQKVAEGILVCVDPSGEVEGRILGPNFFKIYVDKVIRPDTYLPRPLRKKLTVGQIVGNSVAWPSMDVLRKEK